MVWYNSFMAKIVTLPNPILRQKSKNVNFDKNTEKLITELKNTLISTKGKVKGVGLSAIQVGVPKKIFLAYSKSSKNFLVFTNPTITWYSKILTTGVPETKNKYEGCLSVPGLWAIIKRSKSIKIKYQTPNGNRQVRKFSGLTATVIQHEYDHLNGILFIDRAIQQKSPIYELAKDENDKEYLKEIKIC